MVDASETHLLETKGVSMIQPIKLAEKPIWEPLNTRPWSKPKPKRRILRKVIQITTTAIVLIGGTIGVSLLSNIVPAGIDIVGGLFVALIGLIVYFSFEQI